MVELARARRCVGPFLARSRPAVDFGNLLFPSLFYFFQFVQATTFRVLQWWHNSAPGENIGRTCSLVLPLLPSLSRSRISTMIHMLWLLARFQNSCSSICICFCKILERLKMALHEADILLSNFSDSADNRFLVDNLMSAFKKEKKIS